MQWIPARKNEKHYVDLKENLPNPPKANPAQPEYASGHKHKAKAFATDMTVITASKSDLQMPYWRSTQHAET